MEASGAATVRDLDGPTTLCALAHAPISSALSPNRYRTTPSSTFSYSDASAMTTRRSALTPTCSRRPVRVASSWVNSAGIAPARQATLSRR